MNIAALMQTKPNPKIPVLSPGDTVRVNVRVVEGDKERIQTFQGVVIRVAHHGSDASFTVRRVAYGVGVERTFPMSSPMIDKVEVLRHGQVRRARLYYLRGLTTKKARLKEKRVERKPEELELAPPPAEQAEQPVAPLAGAQPPTATAAPPDSATAEASPPKASEPTQAQG
ncbi:MAG: 50S ribosomal protein L19 [Chloroflexi bacterium]|nr:50S ribosomal protein L19 [Chloroflexota bacterium]